MTVVRLFCHYVPPVLLALTLLPTPGRSQVPGTEPFRSRHTVFAGAQLPLNYTAGYRFQFSRRLSAQAQGGLIARPFDRYTLRTLDAFGLDPKLSRAIDRAFRAGQTASVGLNVHANTPWYAGLFGQYVHLTAGPVTPADALALYFDRDFSAFGLLNSPAFVFTLQSDLWVGGLRAGRSFRFREGRFGLLTEASVGRIVATRNTFSSNRSLIDALGVTQRLYRGLDNEVDARLRRNGYLPTLNVLLTYRLR